MICVVFNSSATNGTECFVQFEQYRKLKIFDKKSLKMLASERDFFIMTWKFRPFPRANISVQIIFIIWSKNRENPQFSRHYDNNAVNIGQHYFHNVNFRFAQILIMKIMLTDIHGIFPHNFSRILSLDHHLRSFEVIWGFFPKGWKRNVHFETTWT